ncbi:peptidoglycan-binding protein [Streptomyces sp. NPDC014779]|uniref:peptidoglycan-binding domain-containing protein n=1 Tax=Streptomyces sp. NPDC014779 TaxID=3364911 RepID=UPI0036F9929B
MAAAEDFDPLRIRPYVALPTPEGGDETAVLPPVTPGPLAGPLPPEAVPATPLPHAEGAGQGGGPETMRLLLPGTAPNLAYAGGVPYGEGDAPYGYGADAEAGAGAGSGSGTESGYPEGHPEEEGVHTLAYAPEAPGRGRGRARTGVIAGVVAAAVVGTAALAAALIGGGDESEDRAGVPEVTASASENVAVSEAPTPTPSESASTSATPSPTRTTASASPSPAATRTAPATTAPAAPAPTTRPARPSGTPSSAPAAGTTLRLGSTGDDVRDLQVRLRELGLYSGRLDGSYGRKVEHAVAVFQSYMYIEEDPEGVYGPATRSALEGVTSGRDGGSGGDGWSDGGWG